MKKFIVILILIEAYLPLISTAQETGHVPTQYTYCEIVGSGKFMSHKVTIDIDFGEYRPLFEDKRLRDPQTGELIVFNTMIDAMNYMGKFGWEFVQAYTVTTGGSLIYHYLLKKRTEEMPVENEQLIKK